MFDFALFAWRFLAMLCLRFRFKVALDHAWICWRGNKWVKCFYVVIFGVGILYVITLIS
jgi:hypothetical protein